MGFRVTAGFPKEELYREGLEWFDSSVADLDKSWKAGDLLDTLAFSLQPKYLSSYQYKIKMEGICY